MGWRGGRVGSVASIAFGWVLIAGVVAPLDAATASECAVADAILDSTSDQLAKADAAYQAILQTTPTSACAVTGHKVATNLLAAEKLDTNGLSTDASGLITEAVKTRPQTTIPPALRPAARAKRAYMSALAQQRRGYHDAAVMTIGQALAAYPNDPPERLLTRDELNDLNEARPPHRAIWESQFWLGTEDLILWAIVWLLVLLLAWQLITWAGRSLRSGSLMIAPFQTTAATGASGGAPSADGKGFAAVVGDYLYRLGSISGVEGPDRVSKWGDPMTFPTDLTGVSQLKVINALLALVTRFIPSQDRSLVGLLHSDASGTVGVSLTLESRRNRIKDDRPIWSGDFGLTRSTALAPAPPAGGHVTPSDRPELLYPLAYPVAVWAFWRTVRHPERLGTTDWQSYALFGIGEEFDAMGQPEIAERRYAEALDLDPNNRPAQINLANLLLRSP